jgi:hypothetical protein
MTIVVEFESSSPLADGEEKLQSGFDFIEIIKALAADSSGPALMVAENVFARCAKRKMRQLLDRREGQILMKTREEMPVPPVWTCAASVTLAGFPHRGYKKEQYESRSREMALDLEDLAVVFSDLILALWLPDTQLTLVDALSCKITEVSTGIFKFGMRQLWSRL